MYIKCVRGVTSIYGGWGNAQNTGFCSGSLYSVCWPIFAAAMLRARTDARQKKSVPHGEYPYLPIYRYMPWDERSMRMGAVGPNQC